MSSRRTKMPAGWEVGDPNDDYEYVPLRLPPDVTRVTASMRLAIQAEFGGWELSRVRLYNDGSRRVLLKRRKSAAPASEHKATGNADRTLMKRSTYCGVVDTGPVPGETFQQKVARLTALSAAAKQRSEGG